MFARLWEHPTKAQVAALIAAACALAGTVLAIAGPALRPELTLGVGISTGAIAYVAKGLLVVDYRGNRDLRRLLPASALLLWTTLALLEAAWRTHLHFL